MTRSHLGKDTQHHFGPAEWGMTTAVAVTWGASFLFIAIAIDHVATGVVPVARLFFGALALACFPAARKRIHREDVGRIALLGLVAMTIPFYLYPLAEQSVSSSVTGMINGSIPVTTVVAAAILTRNAPSRRRMLAVLIGFVGIALISFGSVGDDKGATVHGVLFLLAATCCYAFTSILSREMQVKYGTLTVLLWQELFALLFSLPLGIPAFFDSSFSWSALLALIVLGAFGTGFAYVMYGMLMVRAGAVRGVIGVFFTPIVATVLGLLFRDESVTVLAVIGMCVVIVGAYLTSRPDRVSA
ncbi:MAG: DMT family transporter [Acidimicrobiaceae bacterium]|nr:DMT family transporter [Ilumatobacteraceae bacterium]